MICSLIFYRALEIPNMVCVGYARFGFELFIQLFFCLGYPTRTQFSVEYGHNSLGPKGHFGAEPCFGVHTMFYC